MSATEAISALPPGLAARWLSSLPDQRRRHRPGSPAPRSGRRRRVRRVRRPGGTTSPKYSGCSSESSSLTERASTPRQWLLPSGRVAHPTRSSHATQRDRRASATAVACDAGGVPRAGARVAWTQLTDCRPRSKARTPQLPAQPPAPRWECSSPGGAGRRTCSSCGACEAAMSVVGVSLRRPGSGDEGGVEGALRSDETGGQRQQSLSQSVLFSPLMGGVVQQPSPCHV